MTEQADQEAPNWLTELEKKREIRLKARLGHEAGAGAPCIKCESKCPGLDLHFWRKICKNCKCSKEDHDVHDDDIYGWAQFQLLGSKPSKIKKKIVLPGKKDEVELEWAPKGSAETIDKYLKTLAPEALPVKGSQAAQDRKHLLQKQIPIHDIDPTLCHDLTESELDKFQEYIKKMKKSAGVGQVVMVHDRYPHEVPSIETVKLSGAALTKQLDKLGLQDQKQLDAFFDKIPKPHNMTDEKLAYEKQGFDPKIDKIGPSFGYNYPQGQDLPNLNPAYATALDSKKLGYGEMCNPKMGSVYYEENAPNFAASLNPNQKLGYVHDPNISPEMGYNPEYARLQNIIHKNPSFSSPLQRSDEKNAEMLNQKLGYVHLPNISPELGYNPEYARLQNVTQTNPSFSSPLQRSDEKNTEMLNQKLGYVHHPNISPELGYNPEYARLQNITATNPSFSSPLQRSDGKNTEMLNQKSGYVHPEYAKLHSLGHINPQFSSVGDEPNTQKLGYVQDLPENAGSQLGYGLEKSTEINHNPALRFAREQLLANENTPREINRNVDQDVTNSNYKLPNLNPNRIKVGESDVAPTSVKIGAIRDISYDIKAAVQGENALFAEQEKGRKAPEDVQIETRQCRKCAVKFNVGEFAIFAEKSGALYHSGCFKCAGCSQNLADLFYFYDKESDDIYCGRDFAKIRGIPRCKACDELIFVKEYCLAENSTFHLKHFCCFECDDTLAGKNYVLEDSQHICVPCFENLKANRCISCGRVIAPDEQGVALAPDKHFHAAEDCFCCWKCKKCLHGAKLLFRNNKLYCSHDCFRADN